ncbi:MAG: hypothetical protein ACU85E_06535 [Gammaproteobacteria bacterium]
MVKRRTPKVSGNKAVSELTPEQIEAFASGAEGGTQTPKPNVLDSDANRDFKAMRVPFNEYEYEQLVKGAKISGRTKLNFLRYAMLKFSKELQEEEE